MGYEVKREIMLPERAAAIRAGLGVHGLNGLMITPNYGSFQFACPKNAGLKREQPPADMIDCMKLEKLLTNLEFDRIFKYFQLNESSVKPLAVLAAANTGRKDLLPLVEALIGNEDKVLDKIARWAASRLR